MSWPLAWLIASQSFCIASMAGCVWQPLWALREGLQPGLVGALLALFALTQVFLDCRRPVISTTRPASALVGQRQQLAGATGAALRSQFCRALQQLLLTGGATGVASIALQRFVGHAAHSSPNTTASNVQLAGHRTCDLQFHGAVCRRVD